MRYDENILYSDEASLLKTFHSTVDPCKRLYHEHHHTECELSLFLSGSGVYRVHGQTYTFQKGDMFLFGSNEAHCITEIHETIDLLNIHFEPQFLWKNSENAELLNLFAARNKNFRHKFSDDTLCHLILNIEKELTEKLPCYKINVRCLLLSSLSHIVRTYDYIDADKAINAQASISKGLKEALDYINQHFSEPLTLSRIAEAACMSENYFSSVFKKYNGISPWEYITIKRIENAVVLIKTTDMTKLEIAEKCGFSSSSNFYKAFRHITGKAPGDYIKSRRANAPSAK